MSTHHDYTENASRYEAVRLPAGANHIIGALHVRLAKPLSQIRVLDAGCGTGNYAKELLDAGVGHVDLLDANDAMLNIARTKLKAYVEDGRATIVNHHLPSLPYPDKCFDCVMFLAVLHHLDKHDFDHTLKAGEERSYPNMTQAYKEAKRVLQPGGLIIVMLWIHEQIKSCWWMKLMPLATRKMCVQYPDYPVVMRILKNAGFVNPETIAMLDVPLIREEVFLDPEGPLKENVRKSVSLWSFATEQEIEDITTRLTEAKQTGKLDELMVTLDKDATKFGRFSIIFASI